MMTEDEYIRLYTANQHMSGRGLETRLHIPCPWCASGEFMVYRVVDVYLALEAGAVCGECGRGMRAIVTRSGGGVQCEFVQTCGDPGPDYVPAMRRVEP
jgi:hypothetical protein